MSDYNELKRLAEAASNHEWFADDWSDDFGDEKTTIGFRTQEVIAAGNHGIWPEGIQWHRVASTEEGENPLADAAFIAAANPTAVLALIAENHRLESDRAELWRGKRDVEASRDTKSAVIAELKAENEALRKRIDDMSPFKGAPLTGRDTKCLACGGYHYGVQGLPCPNMRVTASAAMGAGEQS